ncbi:ChaN family lipoprotein [Celeribacter sp. PS-C1]|uniref:ChaN family lipoprotein n=1 Tax=Celeribacter sp. PS-C1 TaxID=2820813 RepID=UPI001C668F4E|nr:ChaN family lipoprotein [Celeribacter sp. PS-C1]MBW6418942.1 ChaN family lipoprotein [Celeribacter sp. PS-C1]
MRFPFAVALTLSAGPVFSDQITPEALSILPRADVVLLGEVHDNPLHHAHQAAALSEISPTAVVFEMLTPEQAARVTRELRGDEAALAEALEWDTSGWPDFSMYHPIFAASDAPIFGAALPREEVRRAFFDGAAAVFGTEAERYGLTDPLPEKMQADRQQMQFEAHCEAMPLEMMSGMVEAQRLRDAAFSRAVIEAYQTTGGPVAVITGNGHARMDWGMPAVLAEAAPDLETLSIGQLEAAPEEAPPYNLWLVTAPVERDDPCAALVQ